MAKIHLNRKGVPAKCTAGVRACPLGEHFNTVQEANEYFEKKHTETLGGYLGEKKAYTKEKLLKEYEMYVKDQQKFNGNKDGIPTFEEYIDEAPHLRGLDLNKIINQDKKSEAPLPEVSDTAAQKNNFANKKEKLYIDAIKKDPKALFDISERERTEEMYSMAAEKDIKYIRYIPENKMSNELWKNSEKEKEKIKKDLLKAKNFNEKQWTQLYKNIDNAPLGNRALAEVLFYASLENQSKKSYGKPPEELVLRMINDSAESDTIRELNAGDKRAQKIADCKIHLINQTQATKMAAIEKNPWNLRHIRKQSPEIIKAATEKDSGIIRFIKPKYRTPEIANELLTKYPNVAFSYFKKPTISEAFADARKSNATIKTLSKNIGNVFKESNLFKRK